MKKARRRRRRKRKGKRKSSGRTVSDVGSETFLAALAAQRRRAAESSCENAVSQQSKEEEKRHVRLPGFVFDERLGRYFPEDCRVKKLKRERVPIKENHHFSVPGLIARRSLKKTPYLCRRLRASASRSFFRNFGISRRYACEGRIENKINAIDCTVGQSCGVKKQLSNILLFNSGSYLKIAQCEGSHRRESQTPALHCELPGLRDVAFLRWRYRKASPLIRTDVPRLFAACSRGGPAYPGQMMLCATQLEPEPKMFIAHMCELTESDGSFLTAAWSDDIMDVPRFSLGASRNRHVCVYCVHTSASMSRDARPMRSDTLAQSFSDCPSGRHHTLLSGCRSGEVYAWDFTRTRSHERTPDFKIEAGSVTSLFATPATMPLCVVVCDSRLGIELWDRRYTRRCVRILKRRLTDSAIRTIKPRMDASERFIVSRAVDEKGPMGIFSVATGELLHVMSDAASEMSCFAIEPGDEDSIEALWVGRQNEVRRLSNIVGRGNGTSHIERLREASRPRRYEIEPSSFV